MYRLLKPKNIHRALIALLLLAPIAYLFGTQIGALAGAHGEEVLANGTQVEFVDRVLDFNQLKTNPVPSSLDGYRPYNSSYLRATFNEGYNSITYTCLQNSGSTFLFSPSITIASNKVGHKYCVRALVSSEDFTTFQFDEWGSYSLWNSNSEGLFYRIWTSTNTQPVIFLRPIGSDFLNKSFTLSGFQLYDLTQIYGVGNEPDYATFSADFPLFDYPYTESKEIKFSHFVDGNYSDDLLDNMFSQSNFLTEWGEDALSEDRHGFAPVGELFKYVDDNILHLSDKQIGKMAYGYMYYVVHVLIFDIVALAFVFVVTIPQKLLNMINDKTGGDL